jgi:hypothetical protein
MIFAGAFDGQPLKTGFNHLIMGLLNAALSNVWET